MINVSSWGRLQSSKHDLIHLMNRHEVSTLIQKYNSGLTYGMGRSYGDACLNPGGLLWSTSGLDRFIHFNEKTGYLVCEAGVLLRDINRLLIPRGWMLPVIPGTQWVTVGGAIANDVHGKNHHTLGTFGHHVEKITLIRTTGEVIECSSKHNSEWLSATLGGLGLTGIIVTVALQLRPVAGPWLDTETIAYNHLEEYFKLTADSIPNWEHTVSWFDCSSGKNCRGIFMRANHSLLKTTHSPNKRKRTVALTPPVSLINKISLPVLNAFYFNLKKRKAGHALMDYESFFCPLDNLSQWNRLYGRKGFYQYQSVVPMSAGYDAIKEMLQMIHSEAEGSVLSVLKTFGNKESLGLLSFPQPGVTLALDFPNRGNTTLRLLERLDAIVEEAQGRVYLAKDMRMPRSLFEAGYPRLAEFKAYRDPGISSAMSRRLMGQ